MPDSKTYTGGCHCGLVRFECTSDLAMVTNCNCSICTKKGLHFTFLPPQSFQLRAGEQLHRRHRTGKTRDDADRRAEQVGLPSFRACAKWRIPE